MEASFFCQGCKIGRLDYFVKKHNLRYKFRPAFYEGTNRYYIVLIGDESDYVKFCQDFDEFERGDTVESPLKVEPSRKKFYVLSFLSFLAFLGLLKLLGIF